MDAEPGVDMGGGMESIDMGGIEPIGVPIIGAGLALGVPIIAAAVGLGCAAGEGEPKAPAPAPGAGDPSGNPGAADSAGEPTTPAEPNLDRDEGSGLCEAPPMALDTIILYADLCASIVLFAAR